MSNLELTTTISTGVTVLLSLLALYIPGFNVWFAALTKERKQGTMILLALAVAIIVVLLSCIQLYIFVPCTKSGIMFTTQVLIAWVVSYGISQGIFQGLPQPQAVIDIKSAMKALRLEAKRSLPS